MISKEDLEDINKIKALAHDANDYDIVNIIAENIEDFGGEQSSVVRLFKDDVLKGAVMINYFDNYDECGIADDSSIDIESYKRDNIYIIAGIIVNREFRRAGVGKKLVKLAIDYVKRNSEGKKSILFADTISEDADVFFTSAGFTRVAGYDNMPGMFYYKIEEDNKIVKEKKKCMACNGTGWYDNFDKDGNSIPCGSCDGVGYE